MFFELCRRTLLKSCQLKTCAPLPYTTSEPDIVNFFTRILREKHAFSETQANQRANLSEKL